MQLSAANLLIASQQSARAATATKTDAQFATALAKEKGVEAPPAFEPMAFRQAAPVKVAAPPQAAATAGYRAAAGLGANLDIRV